MSTDITDPIAEQAELLVEHLNGEHTDSILLVARMLGGRPDATSATVVALDGAGFEVVTGTEADGEHSVGLRIPFATPAATVDELIVEALGLVAAARERAEASGETVEATTAEEEQYDFDAIPTQFATVTDVRDIAPGMRRITFTGAELARYRSVGPDEFFYVLLPPPGRTELTIGLDFSWTAVPGMPEEDRPVGAYYTVRARRPELAELDMDFLLHGETGPASRWAATAAPGAEVALWGPRTSFEPPAGTDTYVLAADETGLPAMAGIIAAAPEGTTVHAFVETGPDLAAYDLPRRDDPAVTVTVVDRGAATPGSAPDLLLDAVRAAAWPVGTVYVWGGGESHAMTSLRKHVRDVVGLDRDAVSLIAYWRRGADHTGQEDPS